MTTEDGCLSSSRAAIQPFLRLFVLFGPWMDWMMPFDIVKCNLLYSVHQCKCFFTSRNTFLTLRNNILPAVWAFLEKSYCLSYKFQILNYALCSPICLAPFIQSGLFEVRPSCCTSWRFVLLLLLMFSIVHYKDIPYFVYSIADGHLGYFQLGAVINNGFMNI